MLRRRPPRTAAIASAGLLAFTGLVSAGDLPPNRTPLPVFPVDVPRVDVDFVARSGEGRLLRDLRTEEVEVYEDGVRQAVDSLRLVDAGLPAAAGGGQPDVVAFAFDRLSPAARALAGTSALGHLDRFESRPALVGVFSVERGLQTLVPFTVDTGAVRAGLGGTAGAATPLAAARDRDAVRLGWH
ncbi:MAG TPA: hypothetical protein VEQ10_20800, partial [Vicinamibacteria bacterium]|nr:hypothetical protein [Vicinamibacteria bacterium]